MRHPEYIIRFQETEDGYVRTFGWKREKLQWATFNFNVLIGIALETSVIKSNLVGIRCYWFLDLKRWSLIGFQGFLPHPPLWAHFLPYSLAACN